MNLPVQMLVELASSLLPGSGPVIERLATKVEEELTRSQSRALAVAEQVSGLSREELAERIAADPRLIPLLTRLAYTAGMTGRDELLQTLGAAFGHAAAAPESIDACEAVLIGAASLQPHDVMVLRAVRGRPVLSGAEAADAFTTKVLSGLVGLSLDTVDASLARLNAAGFVAAFHGVYGGGSKYTVNEVGGILCDLLAKLPEASDTSD